MHESQLITNTHKLYNLLAKNILYEIGIMADTPIVHLYVDRSKEVQEINIFDTYIRSHLEANMHPRGILNIEHLRSETNSGLQAVDLFCHGIARKYEQNDNRWYQLFQDKVKRELIFRP